MSNMLEIQLMMQSVRVVLLACEAITTVALDTCMIDIHVRPAALGAMHSIIEEAELQLGRAIRLRFEML